MAENDEDKTDFIAPVDSKRNPLLLKLSIALFITWVGVLLWIISRS
tara:strand:+ start:760 stop:897 length:138 start_codon:yes stop_codon:yes gene_type:complete